MPTDIVPPREPIADNRGFILPAWYRYLVQRKRITDEMAGSAALSVGPPGAEMPNARQLEVATDELVADDAGPGLTYTLGLADTAVDPDTYGEPTRLVVLAIDAKGRVTAASEVKLDVSDVDGLLDAEHGGTGNAAYVIGDLLYASATDALSRLAAPDIGNVLTSVALGTAPIWDKLDLTNSVKLILPELNGGTGTDTLGFSGTGAYTNFTFENGKCTAAS